MNKCVSIGVMCAAAGGEPGNFRDQDGREVEASMEGDTWILNFANGEVWEVPLTAIEGG